MSEEEEPEDDLVELGLVWDSRAKAWLVAGRRREDDDDQLLLLQALESALDALRKVFWKEDNDDGS